MKRQVFDSNFWDREIGRVDMPVELGDNRFDCAWLLVPASHQRVIHAAEQAGGRIMDIRHKLERATGPKVGISRPAEPEDVDALAAIARTAFRGLTRFYADPGFPDDRCDDLYEGWFRENFADPDVDVLMIGDGRGPAGFVTVKMAREEASIVLIAVAEAARGRGMGANLSCAAVNHAHARGIPKISVVTQGCNVPAQRAFQKAGFVTASVDVWLHRWTW